MIRQWRRNWSVIIACVVHMAWGGMLLFSPQPLDAIPLYLNIFALCGLSHQGIGACFIGISLMAWVSMTYRVSNFTSLILVAPQQFVVLQAGVMCVIFAIDGRYPHLNGHEHDAAMIVWSNQLWTIVGAIVHTIAVIDWHFWSPIRKVESCG